MLSVVFISLRTRRLCLGSLQPRQWDCSAVFDQRMGCFVFGFVCKKSYERKQTELISFPLIYVWWKQTMTVSSVISFPRLFHIFVHLFQSPSLLSPRTELPRPKATGWTEFQVCENNYSAQPLEHPGGTYAPRVTWTMCTLVCLPLCATQTLPFSMCAKTTERLGSTVWRAQCLSALSLYYLHRLAQC